jgi:hypothetical protein
MMMMPWPRYTERVQVLTVRGGTCTPWHASLLSGVSCLRNLQCLHLGNDLCTRQFSAQLLPFLVLFRHLKELRIDLSDNAAGRKAVVLLHRMQELQCLDLGMRSWTITRRVAGEVAGIAQLTHLRRFRMILTGSSFSPGALEVMLNVTHSLYLNDLGLDLCGARIVGKDLLPVVLSFSRGKRSALPALRHLCRCRRVRCLSVTLWGTKLASF